MNITHMPKISLTQLAQEMLLIGIDEKNNIINLTGKLSGKIEELFLQTDTITVNSLIELENLPIRMDIDNLQIDNIQKDLLKLLLQKRINQYPAILSGSIAKKKEQYRVKMDDLDTVYLQWLDSPDIASTLTDPRGYIDSLLDISILSPQYIKRLEIIKSHIPIMIQNGYDLYRITIIDNYLAIDGYKLMIQIQEGRELEYDDAIKNLGGLTFPNFAKSMFDLIASMVGEEFDYLVDRNEIQNISVDKKEFLGSINTSKNKKILKKLNEFIGFDICIPVGYTDNKELIYIVINEMVQGFFASRSNLRYLFVPM